MINIKNLVLSGGGVKGYTYIGVLKALEKYNFSKNIETIAGTSIGSIFALFICLEYSSKDLEELSNNFDLERLNNIDTENILNFFDIKGIDNGDNIERIIDIFIKAKTNKTKITFSELYELTKIKLIVNASCLETNKNVLFSHTSHPDLLVTKAIRMSISIPFVYTPVIYENMHYVDGGLTNNFLIELFDNQIENTLGIILEDITKSNNKINDFFDYMSNVLSSLIDTKSDNYEKYNIVPIKTDIIFLDFSIDNNQKKELIETGFNSLEKFLKEEKFAAKQYLDKETQTDLKDIKNESND